MKPKIITFSGKAQAGKTTSRTILTEYLTDKGFKCLNISYGDYVKTIAKDYYGWNGIKDEPGRTLLQELGTDNIRKRNPDFWVHTVIRLVDAIGNDFDYVLIDDARFPNEVYRWLNYNYNVTTINIIRTNYKSTLTKDQRNHLSETAMNNFEFAYTVKASDVPKLTLKLNRIGGKL